MIVFYKLKIINLKYSSGGQKKSEQAVPRKALKESNNKKRKTLPRSGKIQFLTTASGVSLKWWLWSIFKN